MAYVSSLCVVGVPYGATTYSCGVRTLSAGKMRVAARTVNSSSRSTLWVMKGSSSSKKNKKSGKTAASSSSSPGTGFGNTANASSGNGDGAASSSSSSSSSSPKNGVAAKNGVASEDDALVTRVGGVRKDEKKAKPLGEEQQEHELYVDDEVVEQKQHPLFVKLEEADKMRSQNPFRLKEMSVERYEELQFSPGVKSAEVVAQMEKVFAEGGEEAMIEWLTANRWLIRYRTSVALVAATQSAGQTDQARRERLEEILELCIDVRLAYDKPFTHAVQECEKVVKEAVEQPGVAGSIERYLQGKSRMELNAMWTVVYSALAAWNDIAARLGQSVVRRDMVDALREAGSVFESNSALKEALAPECTLLQRVLNASSSTDRQAALSDVTDETVRNIFLLLGQVEVFPFRSYGAMSNSIVQITESIMKRKYGVVETLKEVSGFDENKRLESPDSAQSMLALFSRDLSANDAIRLGAKIREAQAKNQSFKR